MADSPGVSPAASSSSIERRMGLDGVEATVVIGEQQPLRRDHCAGAATAKLANCVFHAGAIGCVQVVGVEFKTQGLHVLFVLLFQVHGQPHTSLGHEQGRQQEKQQE